MNLHLMLKDSILKLIFLMREREREREFASLIPNASLPLDGMKLSHGIKMFSTHFKIHSTSVLFILKIKALYMHILFMKTS